MAVVPFEPFHRRHEERAAAVESIGQKQTFFGEVIQ
jgi:hypothetical protein